MKLLLLIAAVTIFSTCVIRGNSEEHTKKKTCKEHPMISGPCYKVRGGMSLSNGTPSIRIWPVGTRRILGISEGHLYLKEYGNVPEELVR